MPVTIFYTSCEHLDQETAAWGVPLSQPAATHGNKALGRSAGTQKGSALGGHSVVYPERRDAHHRATAET